MNAIFISFGWP